MLTIQKIVVAAAGLATGSAAVRGKRRELRPSEEERGKSRVRVLPGFPSFLDRYILTAM